MNVREYFLKPPQLTNTKDADYTTTYDLTLSVSDQLFTSHARIHILVKQSSSISHNSSSLTQRPTFRCSTLLLNISSLPLNLRNELSEVTEKDKVIFSINLNVDQEESSLFRIEEHDDFSMLVLASISPFDSLTKEYFQIPVLVCSSIQTGMCDQMLVLLNKTGLSLRETITAQLQFAYSYWAITVQQSNPTTYSNSSRQSSTTTTSQDDNDDYISQDNANDDYYYTDENYESHERFYFDIKLRGDSDISFTSSPRAKPEFQLTKCMFTKESDNDVDSRISVPLAPRQIKSTFSLSRHTGVLSSRTIINALKPGVYEFDIDLRSSSSIGVVDKLKFKLIVLSPPSLHLFGLFKFDKEFYKLDYEDSEHLPLSLKLVHRPRKIESKFETSFKLISNRYGFLFSLHANNGQLTVERDYLIKKSHNRELESLRADLNEDYELTLYALALVQHTNKTTLEYMCEIQVDFRSVFTSKTLVFGKEYTNNLKLSEPTVNTTVFRCLAFVVYDWPEKTVTTNRILYALKHDHFEIEESSGEIRLAKKLSSSFSSTLNVTACSQDLGLCAFNILTFDVSLLTNNSSQTERSESFDQSVYTSTIREDSLPGTVLASVRLKRCAAYFILHGDESSRFAISNDGKVYTRLPLLRQRRNYSLTLMCFFSGKYKSLTRLDVSVKSAVDKKPNRFSFFCHSQSQHASVSESMPVGTHFYTLDVINILPDDDQDPVKIDIVSAEEDTLPSPFSIDERGYLRTTRALDYEQETSYEFVIRLSKPSYYCQVKMKVSVNNEDDNLPVFSQRVYTSKPLREHSQEGTLVAKVLATDHDADSTTRVVYSLANSTNLFKMDASAGVLTVYNASALDHELLGDVVRVSVSVHQSNMHEAIVTDTCVIEVHLIDINDNGPMFARNTYYVSVEENAPIHSLITRIEAHDPDVNSSTRYSLLKQPYTV